MRLSTTLPWTCPPPGCSWGWCMTSIFHPHTRTDGGTQNFWSPSPCSCTCFRISGGEYYKFFKYWHPLMCIFYHWLYKDKKFNNFDVFYPWSTCKYLDRRVGTSRDDSNHANSSTSLFFNCCWTAWCSNANHAAVVIYCHIYSLQ